MRHLLAAIIAAWCATAAADRPLAAGEFDAGPCFDSLQAASADTASRGPVEFLAGLYAVGKVDEALRTWRGLVDQTPSILSRMECLYWYCLTLLESERAGEAAGLLEQARGAGLLDSQRSYLHAMTKELLCAAYLELGEFDHAEELSSEIARHGVVPEARVLALYDLARAREGRGDPDGAAGVWDMLVATAERTPEAVHAQEMLRRSTAPPRRHVTAQFRQDDHGFCLHLGSARDSATAGTWVNVTRAAGLDASLRDDVTPVGTLLTVHTECFATFLDASLARARIAESGHLGIAIVACPNP